MRSLLIKVLISLAIFAAAFGVRYFVWQDNLLDVRKTHPGLIELYQVRAKHILADGFFSFFDPAAKFSNPDFLMHPPGYPLLIAAIFKLFGESDAPIQFFSLFCDAISAIVIFLIALRLLGLGVATIAGFLAAFCPPFAVHSVFLLPDTLAILPLLLALLAFVHCLKKPDIRLILLTGFLIGISCWLRSNALLLAPFAALFVLFLFPRGKRLSYAAALVFAAAVTIAPVTIRNYILYDAFIPLSLGTGQILLQGISDYDPEYTLGIPNSDLGIAKQEAEMLNRPDYAHTLFGDDALIRDRMRNARALKVIRENPVWFASIMVRRSFWMLQLEKARRVSTEIPVMHNLATENLAPVFHSNAQTLPEFINSISPEAIIQTSENEDHIRLQTDGSKYGAQFQLAPFAVEKHTDYVLNLNFTLREGRICIGIIGSETGNLYYSTVFDTTLGKSAAEQTLKAAKLPFVSRENSVQVVIFNETPATGRSIVEVHEAALFNLGASNAVWTRPFRLIVQTIQRLITTPVVLPLAIIGLIILIRRRKWQALLILLLIPFYLFSFQSALHTEWRYVLIIHHFLFVLAAVTIAAFAGILSGYFRRRFPRRELNQH